MTKHSFWWYMKNKGKRNDSVVSQFAPELFRNAGYIIKLYTRIFQNLNNLQATVSERFSNANYKINGNKNSK